MTKSKTLAGVATLAMITQGCATHLSTRADLTKTARGEAMHGLTYNLPMLQYKIDVTRTLTRCPADTAVDPGKPEQYETLLSDPEPGIDFSVKVVAKPEYVRGESYVVDYEALNAGTKTTSFTMETYATTGNLKSISASAEDHTGDIIRDFAKVALIAGSFAVGGPAAAVPIGAALAPSGQKSSSSLSLTEREDKKTDDERLKGIIKSNSGLVSIVGCVPTTLDRVTHSVAAGTALDDAAASLKAANARVANATLLVGVRGLDHHDKLTYAQALEKALNDQTAFNGTVEKQTAATAAFEKALSTHETGFFPNSFDSSGDAERFNRVLDLEEFKKNFKTLIKHRTVYANALAVKLAQFKQEIKKDRWEFLANSYPSIDRYVNTDGKAIQFKQGVNAPSNTINPMVVGSGGKEQKCLFQDSSTLNGPVPGECLKSLLTVSALLRFAEAEQTTPSTQFPTLANYTVDKTGGETARDGKLHAGLFIRPPVRGELVVCRADDCTGKDVKNLFEPDPKDPPTYVPQFGQLRFLPFRNGWFANNTLTLKLETDGSLTSFEYKTTKAVAAEIAATAADVASQADAARTKARTEAKDARQAKIDELQYQIDSITKAKALADAQNPADTKAADAIKAETADLAAQAALAEAKLTRLKAEAALAAYAGGSN